ncbi:hypothetical protein HZP98_04485 [Elizabethkingia anophelis]|nr:hypothetical protein [Elizabethkingia anophelis]MCT3951279.1 hypothetical protein [Elizabethkingia anophelis]MCT3954822.1 hypothetical protein [Elizabethkingia anophelis]MCT3986752.1 hypothetical protein [Elizabethkingia anophelis]MCT4064935.1 hypothetical protein [Elizabethkingia anophelis]
MKKIHIFTISICVVGLIVFLNSKFLNSNIRNTIILKKKLSEYNLFEGKMSDLIAVKEALPFDIASPLFTDYADKDRFILLPPGKKMKAKGTGLPDFPDGTIIAKTFYYNNRIQHNKQVRSILETRLLIKHESVWNVAVYKWNEAQNEAFLLENGENIPISFVNGKGKSYSTVYKIPSRTDCISCHRQNDQALPIGPKIRNLNFDVYRNGYYINQLEYLNNREAFEPYLTSEIKQSIQYGNLSIPIKNRTITYLDINCAHCHNPNGMAGYTGLDLRYESTINNTELLSKYEKIAFRMTTSGSLHMPKIGTTIHHKEGIQLIMEYIKSLK